MSLYRLSLGDSLLHKINTNAYLPIKQKPRFFSTGWSATTWTVPTPVGTFDFVVGLQIGMWLIFLWKRSSYWFILYGPIQTNSFYRFLRSMFVSILSKTTELFVFLFISFFISTILIKDLYSIPLVEYLLQTITWENFWNGVLFRYVLKHFTFFTDRQFHCRMIYIIFYLIIFL